MRAHFSICFTLFLNTFFFLGCAGECVLSEGKCPASCQEIAAGPVVGDSSAACIGSDELLSCMEKGANTDDDVCVIAPDGTIYGTNGTHAGRLIEEGYKSCSDEQSAMRSGLTRCK